MHARREDTSGVEPNGGTVIGDLRVLVTPTGGRDPLQHPFGPGGWKVIVSPVDSAEVIADAVRNRRTANRIRDEFVRAVRVGGIDRTDVGRIKRMLKA
jgi:hypothetical protein